MTKEQTEEINAFPTCFESWSNNHSWFYKKDEAHSFPALKKIIVSLFSGLFRVPILGYSIGTGWKNRKLALFLDFSGPISRCSGHPWASPAPSQGPQLCSGWHNIWGLLGKQRTWPEQMWVKLEFTVNAPFPSAAMWFCGPTPCKPIPKAKSCFFLSTRSWHPLASLWAGQASKLSHSVNSGISWWTLGTKGKMD